MKVRILVPLHTYPDGNSDNIAHHVSVYAQYLDADVHALTCRVDFPKVSSIVGNLVINVPAMIEEAKAKSRARGAVLCKVLGTELGTNGIPLRVTDVESFPADFGDIVADRARYHDLVLLGIGQDNQTTFFTTEAVIFGSGRPTLLVPEMTGASVPDHVVIAWDGSRVAARAVADAHEFLRRAKSISIVTVVGEKPLDEHSGRQLTDYLAAHDIQAQAIQVPGAEKRIADVLQTHVRAVGANLLVMGAFGHSRMRDFVLGGATQGVLDNLQVPVLLSH